MYTEASDIPSTAAISAALRPETMNCQQACQVLVSNSSRMIYIARCTRKSRQSKGGLTFS